MGTLPQSGIALAHVATCAVWLSARTNKYTEHLLALKEDVCEVI